MKGTSLLLRVLPILGCAVLLPLFAVERPERSREAQAGYAGSDTCALCHEDIAKAYRKSAHWAAHELKLPNEEARGCESCHGPGEAHANDSTQPIFTFRKEAPKDKSARCLSCHAIRGQRSFSHGVHERGVLSCDTCHASGHGIEGKRADLLRRSETELCASCHAQQAGQARMPFRHRTSDGVLRCSDCHDPHGKPVHTARKQVRERSCYKCHTDKQGPFVFQHRTLTVTGCVTCHEPHGSTNPRLLSRSEVRFLCLECHPSTPGYHDLSSARFQNCSACHTSIHGSHVDGKFLR